jgi:hypothetical protein
MAAAVRAALAAAVAPVAAVVAPAAVVTPVAVDEVANTIIFLGKKLL